MFSRIDSVHLAALDPRAIERVFRQMHLRTRSDQWAERASIVREQGDTWASRVDARPLLDRAASATDI